MVKLDKMRKIVSQLEVYTMGKMVVMVMGETRVVIKRTLNDL